MVMKDDDLERIYDVLEVTKGRVIRILTSVFPRYFAIITRVREDVRSIGPDGGKVVLPQDPRLRATFPKNALYKKIKACVKGSEDDEHNVELARISGPVERPNKDSN